MKNENKENLLQLFKSEETVRLAIILARRTFEMSDEDILMMILNNKSCWEISVGARVYYDFVYENSWMIYYELYEDKVGLSFKNNEHKSIDEFAIKEFTTMLDYIEFNN